MSKKKEISEEKLQSYYTLIEKFDELLAKENPPIPAVMAACNMIMCRVVDNGFFTKEEVLRVLGETLDYSTSDSTTLQ